MSVEKHTVGPTVLMYEGKVGEGIVTTMLDDLLQEALNGKKVFFLSMKEYPVHNWAEKKKEAQTQEEKDSLRDRFCVLEKFYEPSITPKFIEDILVKLGQEKDFYFDTVAIDGWDTLSPNIPSEGRLTIDTELAYELNKLALRFHCDVFVSKRKGADE